MAPRKDPRQRSKQPDWAKRHDKPGSAARTVFVLLMAIGVAIGVFWLLDFRGPPSPPPLALPGNAGPIEGSNSSSPSTTSPAHALTIIPIPDDEKHFAHIVDVEAKAYDDAASDADKAATRPERAQEICEAQSSPHVSRWVGVLKTLDTSSPDRPILAISLDVASVSADGKPAAGNDKGPDITIMASPPFLNATSDMNAGDTVTFSGDLVPDTTNQDCYEQGNPSLYDAMERPSFVMKLSVVKEAQ
jgi:hypothetical protein